jgi:hypothetical protein
MPFPAPTESGYSGRKYQLRCERGKVNLATRVHSLTERASSGTFTPEDQAEYDILAACDQNIRHMAKTGCKRFFAGGVLYSDVIGDLRKEKKLWWLVYNHRVRKRVNTRKIRSLINETISC